MQLTVLLGWQPEIESRTMKTQVKAVDNSEYEVNRIIGYKEEENLYLVEWVGYNSTYNRWLHKDNLASAQEAIDDFHYKVGQPPKNLFSKRMRLF